MTGLKFTVRSRLTLLFGALFLAAGAVLLALNYALVRSRLTPQFTEVAGTPLPGDFVVPAPQVFEGPLPRGGPGTVAIVAGELLDTALRELVLQSLLALLVMAVLSVGAGWVVAGRVLQPLTSITATARRLSADNLHERIGMEGPDDELKELADTFDEMLDRLDATFDSHRRFVANASHELRTPLAVIRTEADVALADPDASPAELRRMAERVRDATQTSEDLIESLLVLARTERGIASSAPHDLAIAARNAVAAHAAEADAAGLTVRLRLEPASVSGDLSLIDRMVGNVFQNAVRHNEPGGWIEMETGVVGDRSRLRVANSGAVVPQSDVARLTEPFQRGANRTSDRGRGPGIGLSIVEAVARVHGGAVSISAFGGGGLEVTVSLPLAPRDSEAGRVDSDVSPQAAGPGDAVDADGEGSLAQ